jgi:eukaryotic-like serine/threonine-protein kinase
MHSFAVYKNLVEIGRGGMATVYRATAPNGNLVALKILALHLAADSTARLRFEQESNLGLAHPNIVRIIDCGVENDVPYIIMDYVVGESLDRTLTREGKLGPQALAPILRGAAEALDYAHSQGIIHRDVKPSNILIRANGQALLADFGVAKSASVTAYTATAARVGSVFYMSPEQADGALEVTPASDIYSLGVTAYYALCGRHPFEGDNEIAIARMHVDSKPKPLSECNPAIPKALSDAVMQALEKDPQRRPHTAGEFARNVEQAVTGPTVAQIKQRRMRWLVTAGLTLFVVSALTAVMVLAGASQTPFLAGGKTAVVTFTSTAAQTASPAGPADTAVPAGAPAQTASATVTPTGTSTSTPTDTATSTATASATPTPEPTATAARRATPTRTPRPAPTSRPRPTATRRATRTPTVAPSDTVTPEPSTPTVPVATTEAPPTDTPPTDTPPTDTPPTAEPPTNTPPAVTLPAATDAPPPPTAKPTDLAHPTVEALPTATP